jgi:hypothetical protein
MSELNAGKRAVDLLLKNRGFGNPQGNFHEWKNGDTGITMWKFPDAVEIEIKRAASWMKTKYILRTTMGGRVSYYVSGDSTFGPTYHYFQNFAEWKQAFDYSLQLSGDLPILQRVKALHVESVSIEQQKLKECEDRIKVLVDAQTTLTKRMLLSKRKARIRPAASQPYAVILPQSGGRVLRPRKPKPIVH